MESTEPTDDELSDSRMSLGDHLDELRARLFKGILAITVAMVVSWSYYGELFDWVTRPIAQSIDQINADQVEKYEEILAEDPSISRLEYFESDEVGAPGYTRLVDDFRLPKQMLNTRVQGGFIVAMKVSFYAALAIGSPVLLWQLWQFIAAGLYKAEKRVALRYFPASVLLFVTGVAFGYFVMMPWGFYFMGKAFPPEKVNMRPDIESYLSLFVSMTLAIGVIFQLPIVMHGVVRLDLIQREAFAKYRAHFVVAAFAISAMITPPDPVTQTLMAVPMVLLYEIGLQSSRLARPRNPLNPAP